MSRVVDPAVETDEKLGPWGRLEYWEGVNGCIFKNSFGGNKSPELDLNQFLQTCNQPETSDDQSDDVVKGDACDLAQPDNYQIESSL